MSSNEDRLNERGSGSMSPVKLEVDIKYLVGAGVVILIIIAAVWKFISVQSDLTKALEANSSYEKQLSVCSGNYTGVDNSLKGLIKQIEQLEKTNKAQIDKVKLSEQRTALIRQNYDKLLQQVDKAPQECKAAMQWLRDQAQK